MESEQQRILQLRDEANRHNYNYYILNQPEISDQEFDRLMHELERLEGLHPEMYDPLSPTQRVGSDLTKEFEHVTHKRPMMSLANSYSIDDVNDWFDRVRRGLEGEQFQVVGELKFDGVSISLRYENGRLVQAVTRGDGEKGDDVTANVKTIRAIPLQLRPDAGWPDEFEIRGEILMPWEVFEKLNAERSFNEEPLFANPRNATAGSLKMQDPRIVAKRHLDCRLYQLYSDHLPADTHYDNMLAAKEWGFKVSPYMRLLNSLQEVDDFIEYWDTERRRLPVATDGLVFKVNSLRQQLNLGFTAKSPRWAIAYKFNPERALTPLRMVTFETGRMGIVTPVANLQPVLLSGTTVKRASLHNDDIMQELDIHEGDSLYVEKGGEIIPKIVGVEKSLRPDGAKPVRFVTTCPECGTLLERQEGLAAWMCPNKYGCPPQITGRIEHFCARKMMNIEGIGEETAELLYHAGLVTSIGDLYSLTEEKLLGAEQRGLGPKTARKIIQGIEDSKKVPFERVVYALSIPNVGETTSKNLAYGVKSMEAMQQMSVEELTAIPDIGAIIARGIYDFLREPINRENIRILTEAGVQMQLSEDKLRPKGDKLEGKTIVISGTFSHLSREQYKALIESEGGKNAGSISKKTSFVLAGENMGPAKREKCEKLGIPILSEDEFRQKLGL